MPSVSVRRIGRAACLAVTAAVIWQTPASAVETRLKEVITLQGVQPAPLVGYGLVVGLNKTGDKRQTIFSTQSLANMADAITRMNEADTAYRAALGAVSSAERVSLLDYLR